MNTKRFLDVRERAMKKYRNTTKIYVISSVLFVAGVSTGLFASANQDTENDRAQANNPLAAFTAVNFHDYYIGDLSESNKTANQFWLRFAQPLSLGNTNWLFRASLPINRYPAPPDNDKETGLGDINAFAAYLFDMQNPAISLGLGPLLVAPTASEDALGSGKWSAGFANVLFDARSKKFQWGYLLTWQHSFAGDDDRDTVNVGAFQPFAVYQLGEGWYLRTTGIWGYNFENDAYSVPIGLGAGRAFTIGKVVYNIFVEPQYSVATDGPGQPERQVFVGFNTQFKN